MPQINKMERRQFISSSSKALLLASAGTGLAGSCKPGTRGKTATAAAGQTKHPGYPMAITMWDFSYFDLLELHIWMVQVTDYYQKTGYQYTPWGNESFNKLQMNGEKEYRANKQYYLDKLAEHIEARAEWFRASGLPIGTTECWGIIDYKDYPLLDWGWVMEICEFGTMESANKGRWKYIGTSNFCGPQFAGMWREIDWHKRLTHLIKQSTLDADLLS
jgi:hypothetical protein